MKAVDELDDNDDEIPRLMVISHAVKVCSVLNKLDVAKKLINQLHTYDKVIQQNIHVDMLLNEAWYLLKADLAKDSIFNYYVRDLVCFWERGGFVSSSHLRIISINLSVILLNFRMRWIPDEICLVFIIYILQLYLPIMRMLVMFVIILPLTTMEPCKKLSVYQIII